MADFEDPSELFLCTWGDIVLFVSSIEWEGGETQVVHDLAAGDEHPVQPRGSRIRTATAQVMFDDFDGQSPVGLKAFRRFQATTKERRIFTHPVDGSYFARIGEFKQQMDENSIMRATVEIIPDAVVPPVSPASAGNSSISGESSVAAAADVLSQKLSDAGIGFSPESVKKMDFSKPIKVSVDAAFSVDASVSISANVSASATASISATAVASASAAVLASARSSAFAFANAYAEALAVAETTIVAQTSGMPNPGAFAFAYACSALDADARASVASWTDEDATLRKIAIDATRLSDSIVAMIELGGFYTDLQMWPALRSAILLGSAVRTAMAAATSNTPSVFVMRVLRPTSLLARCAKIYGGFEAEGRAAEIRALNDISTPAWLEPGDYLMPARPVAASSAFLGEADAP